MARFRWTLTFLWCFCTSLAYGASVPATASHLLADGIGKFISQGVLQGALGTFDAVLRIEQSYDYVVVGGGTAGNTIGTRLAEAGFSVAIIEAGSFYEIGKPMLGSTPAAAFFGIGTDPTDVVPAIDWRFLTEPQAGLNNRAMHYARGKALGGSSAVNFMIHHRGTTESQHQWAEKVGDSSYELSEFLPYFKKSMTFTPPNNNLRPKNITTQYNMTAFSSPGGPVQVSYSNFVSSFSTWLEKGFKAIGLSITTGFDNGNLLGYHYSQATIRPVDQSRSSSADFLYSANNTTLQNLKIYTDTLARKVLFEGKRATGVQVSQTGGIYFYEIMATKEVILSAGAFQSPQLLMLSGIGPRDTLAKFDIPALSVLDGVGQNMWDHILFGPSYEINLPTLGGILHDPVALAAAINNYTLLANGPLSTNIVEIIGWEKLPSDYRKGFSQATEDALSTFPSDWPEIEYLADDSYTSNLTFPILDIPFDGKQYATILGAMVSPLSRGNVTLASRDPNDLPKVNPNFLAHPADQQVAIASYKRLRDIWDTPAMRSIRNGQDEAFPGLDKSTDNEILAVVKETLSMVWHAACTCKMGKAGDPTAVVDNLSRVFGVQGLRVVDASAFPLLPPGHPMATVYALAEKIADAIIMEKT